MLGEGTGNHVHYGVREFGMAAIMNGVALHGGLRPYGGTFLTFSDYSRNALRMSALMKLPVVHVFTHDSIGLGEDGLTHQPVEHVSSLRLVPWPGRVAPADATETAVAGASRCAAPMVQRAGAQPPGRPHAAGQAGAQRSHRAAATCCASRGRAAGADRHRLGTLQVALAAAALLTGEGIAARRLGALAWTSSSARTRATAPRSSAPAAAPRGGRAAAACGGNTWARTATWSGMDRFGESAPAGDLFRLFGITAEMVAGAPRARSALRAQREAVTPLDRTWRAGLQRQQPGTDPGHHGRPRRRTGAGHPAGLGGARKYAGEPFLRKMVEAAVEMYPDIRWCAAPGPRRQPGGLPCRPSARLHQRDDGRLAAGGRQDAFELRLQRRGHAQASCEMAHAVGVSVEGELGCLGSLEPARPARKTAWARRAS